VAKERTPSTLHYLLDAAAGAGAYCEAVRAWFDVRAEAPQDVASVQSVPLLTGCYDANPNVAGPSQFATETSRRTHGMVEASGLGCDGAGRSRRGVPVWHVNYRRETGSRSPRIARCSLTLRTSTTRPFGPPFPLWRCIGKRRSADTRGSGVQRLDDAALRIRHAALGGQAPFAVFNPVLMPGAGGCGSKVCVSRRSRSLHYEVELTVRVVHVLDAMGGGTKEAFWSCWLRDKWPGARR